MFAAAKQRRGASTRGFPNRAASASRGAVINASRAPATGSRSGPGPTRPGARPWWLGARAPWPGRRRRRRRPRGLSHESLVVEASSNWTLLTDIARATPCVCGASSGSAFSAEVVVSAAVLLDFGGDFRAGRRRREVACSEGCRHRFVAARRGCCLYRCISQRRACGAAEFDPDAAREVSGGDVVRRAPSVGAQRLVQGQREKSR